MLLLPLFILLFCIVPVYAAEGTPNATPDTLRVPAYTAYIEPDVEGVSVSDKDIKNWKDATQSVNWFGMIRTPGTLHLALDARLPAGQNATLRLTVAGQARTARVENGMAKVDFGEVLITTPGYQKFRLEGLEKSGDAFPALDALVLNGTALKEAHFNLKPRRNAASVHLGYPFPDDWNVEAFYNEVTPLAEPVASYYMACGFSRGYFGMQVNSLTERRLIFSIWDSGGEAKDRTKVNPEDLVQLLGKGEGVYSGGFGNEGTGGHSHLVFPWKTGQTYRFLVTVKPDGTHTNYSGYFYFPEKQAWGLIASFRAPKDGKYLRGLYSFNENFGGDNGQLRRLAMFGPQWVKTSDGVWHELTTARFTHDGTGKDDRHDYNASGIGNRFYLSNGGFTNDPQTEYKAELHRESIAKGIPPEIVLPPIEIKP
jgi:hypothetical protein